MIVMEMYQKNKLDYFKQNMTSFHRNQDDGTRNISFDTIFQQKLKNGQVILNKAVFSSMSNSGIFFV